MTGDAKQGLTKQRGGNASAGGGFGTNDYF